MSLCLLLLTVSWPYFLYTFCLVMASVLLWLLFPAHSRCLLASTYTVVCWFWYWVIWIQTPQESGSDLELCDPKVQLFLLCTRGEQHSYTESFVGDYTSTCPLPLFMKVLVLFCFLLWFVFKFLLWWEVSQFILDENQHPVDSRSFVKSLSRMSSPNIEVNWNDLDLQYQMQGNELKYSPK